MSLIYKSIKKIQREKVKSSLPEQSHVKREKIGVVPKSSHLMVRFLFYVLGMSIVLFSVYVIVNKLITDMKESENIVAQKRTNTTNKKEHTSVSNVSSNKTQNSTDRNISKTLESSFRKLYPPIKKITKPLPRRLDYNKKTYVKELRQYFSKQIQKNNRIFSLQRQLQIAYLKKDEKKFFSLLKKIKKLLGKQSLFVLKWEGVWELRAKHYVKASQLFVRALNINPEDKTCQINLIYALIGQKQYTQAQKKLDQLKLKYPDDPRLKQLTKLLALRKE